MLIQPGKSGLPFFAIVPPAEESVGYAILARHMGPDQAVYKIQRHAPSVGKRPYTEQEMRSMASEYAAAIRSAEPEGPYCLGGLCDGTHIAEQVVLELEAQGHEVALFAIFDTWVLQNSLRPYLWWLYYYKERLRDMQSRGLAEQLRVYRQAATNRLLRWAGKIPARTAWLETYWPSNYVARRFRAPIALFKRPKQPFFYVNDPQMGWGRRTEGRVEIIEIDFHHAEILREPHVSVLGQGLAARLEQVSYRRFGQPSPGQGANHLFSTT
jgi:thioesterase domain-containing protein